MEDDEEEMDMEAIPTGVYVLDRNKRNSCLYCTRKVRLLWRHMKTCHRDEDDVRQIMVCEDAEKGRKITLLRFKGNFEHNKRIQAKGKGELIVGRRAAGDYKASDFLPCPHCLQYILRSDLKKKHTGKRAAWWKGNNVVLLRLGRKLSYLKVFS